MPSILEKDRTKGLGQILKEKYVNVPIYQRAYAWKREKVDELFDDLRRAIENNREYYFLGLVVGCQADDSSDDIEIVDGQQRLATTAILLGAIRNHFHALGETLGAAKFEERYLFREEGFVDPVTRPSIRLGEIDDGYFQKRVIAKNGQPAKRDELRTSSHRLIDDAAKAAAKFVKDEIAGTRRPREQLLQLERWSDFIRDKARVVFIVVNTTAEAYMIFETLNDRGMELTVADLTKNYLFMTAATTKTKEVSRNNLEQARACWDRMTSILSAASEGAEITKTYIHHLWSSYNGVTRDKELFKELRDKYDNPAKALEFVKLLSDTAPVYAALGNSDSDYWRDRHVKRHLAVLNSSLKATQVRMLLLAAAAHFKQSEFEEIIKCCVWWSIRFLVAGGTPSAWESHYAQRAKAIRNGKYANGAALIDDMAGVVPGDDRFKTAFAEYSPSKAVSRYLLNCLECAKLGTAFPHLGTDDPELANREHILPESPDHANWPTYSREDHERLKDRLGNHTLLTPAENTARQNGKFESAKIVYGKSNYAITKSLAKVSGEWTEDEIDKRQREMAEMAVLIWPIKPPAKPKRSSGKRGNRTHP